jgi:LPXTG-motif cell wall-anchored protein
MKLSASNLIKILLFILVTLAVALSLYFDLLHLLTLEKIRFYQQTLGWWAPVVFLMVFTLGELLQIPSVIWILCAGIIWPTWLALPVALISALSAATCSFLVARYFLGNRFHEKLPDKFQTLNDRLEEIPLRGVILVRLTTFLHPIMHWVLAASSIKLSIFVLGTLIGILPLTVAIVLTGEVILIWWEQYSYVILGAAVLLVTIFLVIRRKRRKADEGNFH